MQVKAQFVMAVVMAIMYGLFSHTHDVQMTLLRMHDPGTILYFLDAVFAGAFFTLKWVCFVGAFWSFLNIPHLLYAVWGHSAVVVIAYYDEEHRRGG